MATSAPARPARRQEPFSRVAPMLGAALLIGAGGGFVLATVLTLTRAFHVATGAWWVALAQAHGHLQLYGWAGLFVLGVALHFLPRLRGAGLVYPNRVPELLKMLVAGIVLRGIGQPLFAATGQGIWKIAMVTSGALEAFAFLGFLAILVATAMQGPKLSTRPQLQKTLPVLIGIFASLGLAAIVNLFNVSLASVVAVAGV